MGAVGPGHLPPEARVPAAPAAAGPPGDAVATDAAASAGEDFAIEPMTAATVTVMVVCVLLSCASVCVETLHVIPGTVLGWVGRAAALVFVTGLTLALSLLAIPTDADKDDDGKGSQPAALTRIPRSVRDSWPWRGLLGVGLAWDVFLTYVWGSSLLGGTWPSVANDAALGAWASWLAFAFLWAGKTPLSLGG